MQAALPGARATSGDFVTEPVGVPAARQEDGITVTVFAFDIAGDQIRHIWAVRNPGKLRPWTPR